MKTIKTIWLGSIILGLGAFHAQAKTITSTVTIQGKVRLHQVCGVTMQSLEATSSSPEIEVRYQSIPLGSSEYRVVIPQDLAWSNFESSDSKQTKVAKSIRVQGPVETKSDAILLPDLPIFSMDDRNPNRLCDFVKNYQAEFKKIKIAPLTGNLFTVSASKSATVITLKNVTAPLPSSPKAFSNLALVKKDGNAPVDYLIITQDMYRPEADELANFRNTQGYHSLVTNVTQLPGYATNSPTPSQCSAPYQRECYLTPSEDVTNVTGSAASSLIGMRRMGTVSNPSSRIVYTPGPIRAYLRQMRLQYPGLKAVLLIGDPEVIPASAYQPGQHGDTNLHLGTDVYYMEPFVPLNATQYFHSTSKAFIAPGSFQCWTGSGPVTYRQWCLPGETRKEGTEDRTSFNYPIKLAKNTLPYYPYGNLSAISQWVPVGRIITQSNLKPGNHDDSVQNYVTKLKYWESHLPSKYGNSFFTVGGSQKILYNYADFDNLISNYGSNSKIYVSKDYLEPGVSAAFDPGLPAACPTCTYKAADEVLQEASLSTHTAWEIVGHGGHIGVQAPNNFLDGTKKNYFAVGKQYSIDYFGYNGIKGVLTHSDLGVQNALLGLLGNGNQLIGHVFANSCDVASYHLFNKYFEQQRKAEDPNLNQASFAETLIGMPGGGAINTYMNNNVGWTSSDNLYNRNFANAVNTAWSNCGRIGDAVIEMISNGTAGGNRFAMHNRVFMGDPLAKIARPPAHCIPYLDAVKVKTGASK